MAGRRGGAECRAEPAQGSHYKVSADTRGLTASDYRTRADAGAMPFARGTRVAYAETKDMPAGSFRWTPFFLAACVASACGSSGPLPPASPPPASPVAPSNAVTRQFRSGPIWLRRGCSRALAEQGRHGICGVDGIIGATNPATARTGAEAKARANLARRIRTAVKAGLRSYHATGGGGAGDRLDEEHDMEEISKEITEMTLVGVKVEDTYVSPDGSFWVMVFMDLDSFRDQVRSLDQYDEGMRKEILGRAEEFLREPDDADAHPKKVGPAWLVQFPSVCSVGESGPTLVPTDALAEARRKARALLATKSADRKTRSATAVVTSVNQSTVQQLVLEQSDGWTRNSEIVAMWYDTSGSGPETAAGSAYALACPLQDIPPDAVSWIAHWREQRGGPGWLYSLAGDRPRLCVVGVCGPTLNKSDANTNAEENARAELAEAIALHANSVSAVFENDETLYAAVTKACDGCEEEAKAGLVVDRWFDEKGEGPLPFAGTAYALMCLGP